MKSILILTIALAGIFVQASELIYQFDCPDYGYKGEVYKDKALIYQLNRDNKVYYTTATGLYKPVDEEKEHQLTYHKWDHSLEWSLKSGEITEMGYYRYNDRINLNLETNDIEVATDWMLIPIPIWKTIREYKIPGSACKVIVNKWPREPNKPYQPQFKKSDLQF